jgi:hypothetical protein
MNTRTRLGTHQRLVRMHAMGCESAMIEAARIAAQEQYGDEVARLRILSLRKLGNYHALSAFAYSAEAARTLRGAA